MGFHLIIRKTLITLAVIVCVPILVVALPVILPYMAVNERMRFRRLTKRPCDDCGQAFDHAEIARARDDCRERNRKTAAEIMARGGRPRIVSIWHVRCPNCGSEFTYAPSTARLNRAAKVT